MPTPAQAIVLAAGRGERMRPLTDTCPKPLLPVHGKPLMQWAMEALARGGIQRVVINTAWLGEQIEHTFGSRFRDESGKLPSLDKHNTLLNSEQMGVFTSIIYSHEGRDFGGALETAGGIVRVLPLLDDVFWVLAGDVFAPDFQFAESAVNAFRASGQLAHLWLVPNPEHNPRGDFGLAANGLVLNLPKDAPEPKFTYSTIGLYHRDLFALPFCAIPRGNAQGVKAALAPLLRAAMDQGRVTGERFDGRWVDVGTPERLQWLNQIENTPKMG